ncbi:MAG: sulfurtransferase-like selenium metabolism protein YedF [Proteobacteria bacterium]|nr:sulfurtransferase-like selenium metabolism protein YedF [Desulfobulbaceae bacterium]MBU4152805.1 sulfurtransferase-like selenium metabolism protein YedF [Pseudomonadota bacterium]MDP2105434.1 sulfurtransferase-like selenium metabolism protein YedF [Desulfobulbaceae bacterium]
MIHEVDCRGHACPEPVMQVKGILEQYAPTSLAVIVDNMAAAENVIRFLEYGNFQIVCERVGKDFRVVGTRDGDAVAPVGRPEPGVSLSAQRKILVMVATDRMGHGDDGLGAGLLINFLKTLKEMGPELWRLVLVNGGVTLAVEGSPALPILQGLAGDGVRILVCGTCLDHFKLLDKKQVGETTNMLDIVTGLQLADSIINV